VKLIPRYKKESWNSLKRNKKNGRSVRRGLMQKKKRSLKNA